MEVGDALSHDVHCAEETIDSLLWRQTADPDDDGRVKRRAGLSADGRPGDRGCDGCRVDSTGNKGCGDRQPIHFFHGSQRHCADSDDSVYMRHHKCGVNRTAPTVRPILWLTDVAINESPS